MQAQVAEIHPKHPVFAEDKLFQIYHRIFKQLAENDHLFEAIPDPSERLVMKTFYDRSRDPMLYQLPEFITDYMNLIERHGHSPTLQYPQPEICSQIIRWMDVILPKLQALGPDLDTLKTLIQKEPIHKQWINLDQAQSECYPSTLIISTEV